MFSDLVTWAREREGEMEREEGEKGQGPREGGREGCKAGGRQGGCE